MKKPTFQTQGDKIYRELTKSKMENAIKELSDYYSGDEEQLQKDIVDARRGQVGVIGDLAVIAWVAGQLQFLAGIDRPTRSKKK